jgi:replicative DNA helicase
MSMTQPQYFAKYGKQFQEKIFQSLINDHRWAAQMLEVMTPSYFDVKYLEFLAQKYFDFYSHYKTFPTMNLIVTMIKDELREGTDIILRDQIIEYLMRIKSNPDAGDLSFVKDKSLDFCRKQALKEALEESVKAIASEQYESVVGIMKAAISKGSPSSIGHDFFNDYEARFLREIRTACPTGIPHLDKKSILNGGLGKGEIGVITAPTGVGKSHFLVAMGAAALRAGKNVIHYTFELSESAVGTRYDSNLCGINSSDIIDKKEEVLKFYEKESFGRLIIKEYPTGSASIVTLRNHIEKLMMKSFKTHLIIIDYADIMRSTRKYDSLRHELKLIYEELRNMAMEMSVPIWTASQANREASNAQVVGLENMAEAYGKAMVADVVLSISRKPMEKATGDGRLFIAKNRAGRDGILFPIKIDTSMSTIKVVDDVSEMSLQDAVKSDNQDMKSLLKSKWKEIQG